MTDRVQTFYGRWVGLYDLIARHFPGIRRVRERASDLLDLEPGDTVVEVGCGTGANLPWLREQVGPSGQVVAVDLTEPMVSRARRRVERRRWDNVHLVRGDAERPPVNAADAVLATFVVGLLDDPAPAVDRWCSLVEPDGTVVLLDARSADQGRGRALNWPFKLFVTLSTPPTRQLRYDRDLLWELDHAVDRSHERLSECSRATVRETGFGGLLRVTAGSIGPGGG